MSYERESMKATAEFRNFLRENGTEELATVSARIFKYDETLERPYRGEIIVNGVGLYLTSSDVSPEKVASQLMEVFRTYLDIQVNLISEAYETK